MNIIDEIKLYVKHGKLPIVQDKKDDYFIVNIIDDEVCRISEYEDVKSNLKIGGDTEYCSEEDIKRKGWNIVGRQFDLPLVPFTVGQSVKVREDLAEVFDVSDWDGSKKRTIGKMCIIKQVYEDIEGLNYLVDFNELISIIDNRPDLKLPRMHFRHDWLLPVLETKRTVDDVLAGLSDEDKQIIMERLK